MDTDKNIQAACACVFQAACMLHVHDVGIDLNDEGIVHELHYLWVLRRCYNFVMIRWWWFC